MEDYGLFEQILLMLIGAVVGTALFRRLKLPPILAYLALGALIGPFAMQLSHPGNMALLSEMGVVFLLFMLGLEFSLPKMIAMRRTVLGLGSAQVLLTSLVFIGMSLLMGMHLNASIVIAGALALSSTAIVTKELIRMQHLSEPHGQLSFGILLFQDIAAVIFLILVPALGTSAVEDNAEPLWLVFMQGGGLLLALLFLGHKLLPALFNEIARERSDELFVLVALVTAMGAAWLTHAAGLSMALGGFLAGMMLGESHFKHQLESDIRPFRDVLLGLFFISVGMQLDLSALVENIHWVVLTTLLLITAKLVVVLMVGVLFKHPANTAFRASVSLAQGGEFGFALLAVALSYQVIDTDLNAVLVSTIILSMVLTPTLMNMAERWANRLFPLSTTEQDGEIESADNLSESKLAHLNNHVIICGYGRVGQIIARFLKQMNIPYIAVDPDPVRIREASTAGEPAYYGDAKRVDILRNLGTERARLVILTIPAPKSALEILRNIKREFGNIPVLVRTQDDSHLEQFQSSGAAEVIPEALEGSLMLVSHVMTLLGVPTEEIKERIRTVRSQRYQILHGFVHGDHSKKLSTEESLVIQRHAVVISESAFACGKRIEDFDFDLAIVALIHAGEETENPSLQSVLAAGDTLIISGSPSEVELAEERLLLG